MDAFTMPAGPQVFALGATQPFGARVAARLGVPLASHEERAFEDGEHKARPLVNVRGQDAYVVHSLHGDASQSANDKLVRLLMFLGTLRDAGAARVTAVVPYLAYARKDQRSKARDPVATRYVARFFESVGCDAVVTFDVHNLAAFENAFRCRADNLSAAGVIADHMAPAVGAGEVVVVAPDAGGIKRAAKFRQLLARRLGREVGMGFVEKSRSEGVLAGGLLAGEVRGRTAIVIDDMVSAGRTLALAARACRDAGATRILAAATHGLFTAAADEAIATSPIERMVVTDTVGETRSLAPSLAKRIERVSVCALAAEAIARLHAGGAIEDLVPA